MGDAMFETGAGGQISDKQSLQLAPIPTTTLSDTEFVGFRLFIPSGFTLEIYSLSVQNDANNAPANLTAEVRDETNATTVASTNQKRETGDPIATVGGAIDAFFRINNQTGNLQNATAVFGYIVTE